MYFDVPTHTVCFLTLFPRNQCFEPKGFPKLETLYAYNRNIF